MNHWNNRKEAVYDYLNNSGAHVMCLQEVKSTQADEITAALAAYDSLSDNQKKLVTNLAKLEALENPAPPAPEYDYGDVNGDNAVDAEDALLVLKTAVGKVELSEDQCKVADVDGSGKLDASDALYILKKAVDKIQEFPVE